MYAPDVWPREAYWHLSDGTDRGPDSRHRDCCLPPELFGLLPGEVAYVPGHAESRAYPTAEAARAALEEARARLTEG